MKKDTTFKKGEGGRPKGSKNRVTAAVRESLTLAVKNSIINIEEDLQAMKPKDRLNVITNLLKYIIPTLKASEMELKAGKGFDNADLISKIDAMTMEQAEKLLEDVDH